MLHDGVAGLPGRRRRDDLARRDRRILYLRFFKRWTQQEIADELGVTQMQVSRLLARVLGRLRTLVATAAPGRVDAR
ncbi:sigma-70 family RNA polymerase sigma factor [Jiangella aurantiaca]|uniref:Sigma-70 family RNA polymerase sigma factor n=1 Tax=Jiangella aurantiaca TaxID=2530373 RepID=A0A4R5AAC9_9ACTN|nr:sigma-70 family RNA polymerase sigma factor [Jiangella aurantiaca]